MQPLISVIIPVYNVEKYIKCCLESVLSQPYKNIEIILVNDGSLDNSGQICEEFSKKDKRIKVIHKENGGLSDARNWGIQGSTGDYLLFLDSDDFLKEGCMEEIAELLIKYNPDVLISLLYEYYEEGGRIVPEKFPLTNNEIITLDKVDLINRIFGLIEWPAQKYIVKRKIIVDNNLFFKVGFLHEDVDWTTRLFITAKRYAFNDKPFYFHRMDREGSITNTLNPKRVNDVITIVSDLISDLKRDPTQKDIFEEIASRLSKSAFYYLSLVYSFDNSVRDELISLIKSNLFIFSYSKKSIHRIFYYMLKLLGVRISCYLLYQIKKMI